MISHQDQDANAIGTDRLRDQYQARGYIVSRGAVESGVIARAHEHVRETIAAHPGLTYEQLHKKPLWLDDPFYLELVRQPGMIDIARALLGPDLALFATGYIVKAPGNSPAVLWHQDGEYWPLEPMEVCTLWLAITESCPENGCMRVIPATHTLELQPHGTCTEVRNLLDSQIDPSLVDESKAVDLWLQPGDVSAHHPNVIHGSNANTSDTKWRLSLVARIIRASTKVTDPDWPGVFHLAGRRREDINRYRPEFT